MANNDNNDNNGNNNTLDLNKPYIEIFKSKFSEKIFNSIKLEPEYLLQVKQYLEANHPNFSELKYKEKKSDSSEKETKIIGDSDYSNAKTKVNINKATEDSYFGDEEDNNDKKIYYENYDNSNAKNKPKYFLRLKDGDSNKEVDVTDKIVLLRVQLAGKVTENKNIFMTFGYNGYRITVKYMPDYPNNIYIFTRILFFFNSRIMQYIINNNMFKSYSKLAKKIIRETNTQTGGDPQQLALFDENTGNKFGNYIAFMNKTYSTTYTDLLKNLKYLQRIQEALNGDPSKYDNALYKKISNQIKDGKITTQKKKDLMYYIEIYNKINNSDGSAKTISQNDLNNEKKKLVLKIDGVKKGIKSLTAKLVNLNTGILESVNTELNKNLSDNLKSNYVISDFEKEITGDNADEVKSLYRLRVALTYRDFILNNNNYTIYFPENSDIFNNLDNVKSKINDTELITDLKNNKNITVNKDIKEVEYNTNTKVFKLKNGNKTLNVVNRYNYTDDKLSDEAKTKFTFSFVYQDLMSKFRNNNTEILDDFKSNNNTTGKKTLDKIIASNKVLSALYKFTTFDYYFNNADTSNNVDAKEYKKIQNTFTLAVDGNKLILQSEDLASDLGEGDNVKSGKYKAKSNFGKVLLSFLVHKKDNDEYELQIFYANEKTKAALSNIEIEVLKTLITLEQYITTGSDEQKLGQNNIVDNILIELKKQIMKTYGTINDKYGVENIIIDKNSQSLSLKKPKDDLDIPNQYSYLKDITDNGDDEEKAKKRQIIVFLLYLQCIATLLIRKANDDYGELKYNTVNTIANFPLYILQHYYAIDDSANKPISIKFKVSTNNNNNLTATESLVGGDDNGDNKSGNAGNSITNKLNNISSFVELIDLLDEYEKYLVDSAPKYNFTYRTKFGDDNSSEHGIDENIVKTILVIFNIALRTINSGKLSDIVVPLTSNSIAGGAGDEIKIDNTTINNDKLQNIQYLPDNLKNYKLANTIDLNLESSSLEKFDLSRKIEEYKKTTKAIIEEYNAKLQSAKNLNVSSIVQLSEEVKKLIVSGASGSETVNISNESLPYVLADITEMVEKPIGLNVNDEEIYELIKDDTDESKSVYITKDKGIALLELYKTEFMKYKYEKENEAKAKSTEYIVLEDITPDKLDGDLSKDKEEESTNDILNNLKKKIEKVENTVFKDKFNDLKLNDEITSTIGALNELNGQMFSGDNVEYYNNLYLALSTNKLNFNKSNDNSINDESRKLFRIMNDIITTMKQIKDSDYSGEKLNTYRSELFYYMFDGNTIGLSDEQKNQLYSKMFNVEGKTYTAPQPSPADAKPSDKNNSLMLLYIAKHFREFLEGVLNVYKEDNKNVVKKKDVLELLEKLGSKTIDKPIGEINFKGEDKKYLEADVNTKNYETDQVNVLKLRLVDIKEDILGAARVYVLYRDTDENSRGQPDEWTDKFCNSEGVNCIVKKSKGGCVDMERQSYGPYATVFDNSKPEDVFKQIEDDRLVEKTILADEPQNLVFFGYGFSGSGKTYTLLNAGTNGKESILGKVLTKVGYKGKKAISLEISELYPAVLVKDKEKKANPIINYDLSSDVKVADDGNSTPFTKADGITLEDIKKKITAVENLRKKALRITPTTNNPESSRSHLFISLTFGDEPNAPKLTIIDMAGAENVRQINKQFLSNEEITNALNKESKIINPYYDEDKNKKREGTIVAIKTQSYIYGNLKAVTNLSSGTSAGHLLLQLQKNNTDKLKFEILKTMGNEIYKHYTGISKSDTSGNNAYKQIILYTEYEILTILSGKSFSIRKIKVKNIKEPLTYIPNIINYFLSLITIEGTNTENPYDNPTLTSLIKILDLEYFIDADAEMFNGDLKPEMFKKLHTFSEQNKNLKIDGNTEESDKVKTDLIFLHFFWLIENKLRNYMEKYMNLNNIDNKDINSAIYTYYIILLKIILAYVNLIVKQGKGIVTTIEHLKYFFLQNTPNGRGIIKYNNAYDEHTGEEKIEEDEEKEETEMTSKDRKFNSTDIVNEGKTYSITGSDGKVEKVQMGYMSQYKMIERLLKYGKGANTQKLTLQGSIKSEGNNDTNKYLEVDYTDVSNLKTGKYVMMAHINRGKFKKNADNTYEAINQQTYKDAAKLTLEFTRDITSMVGECAKPTIAVSSGGASSLKSLNKTKKNPVKLHTKKAGNKQKKLYRGAPKSVKNRKRKPQTKRSNRVSKRS